MDARTHHQAPPEALRSLIDRRPWLVACALAVLAAASYSGSFSTPFIFDDHPAIETNPTIRSLREAFFPPADGRAVTGRPVVNLSLALNYAWGGFAVEGYHLFNFAVHLCAGWLLFGFLRRTLASASLRDRFGRDASLLAAIIAALWLVHPLQTESVTFVVQRTESLVSLFYLLMLYCFARAIEPRATKAWLAAAVVACGVGMATKEVMVSAPLVMLLYDRAFVAGTFGAAWSQRRSFYTALAATWLVLAALVSFHHGVRDSAVGFDPAINPWTYLLTSCRAIVLYVKLAVWPHPLVIDYGTTVVQRLAEVWPQAVILCGGFAASVIGVWRNTPWGFWALWFFALLAPSSSVVPLPAQVISEHRMYLPLAPVLVGGVLAASALARHRGLVTVAAFVLALVALTSWRNHDYRREESIWQDAVAKLPTNWRAHYNLGWVHEAHRHDPACIPDYENALRLRPDYVAARTGLASTLISMGRTGEAATHAAIALRTEPNNGAAHCILGLTEIRAGRPAEAIGHLQIALSQNLNDEESLASHGNLGIALVSLGRPAEAIAHFQVTLRLRPEDTQTHRWLGHCYMQLGRFAEAAQQFDVCLRLDPNDTVARKYRDELPNSTPAAAPK